MGHVVILCIEDYILETIYLLYRVSGIFHENTLKLYFIVYRKLFTIFFYARTLSLPGREYISDGR